MTGLHYLIVPANPDRPMEIDHPADCPQHGKLASVRHPVDKTYLCLFEEAQWRQGLETVFRRADEDVPLFSWATQRVEPGRHVIGVGPDGLFLGVREAAAA